MTTLLEQLQNNGIKVIDDPDNEANLETIVIDWVNDFHDPEEVFYPKQLEAWASRNGYVKKSRSDYEEVLEVKVPDEELEGEE